MAIFEIKTKKVKKVRVTNAKLERSIQKLFEDNLEEILNIIFLASEYSTTWGGRIDTLGIDKNGSPVIIEYKLNKNENVINQSLSYLRWLLDHKAEFEKLCQKKYIKIEIDWNSPRVICIAESFNKFDLDTVSILPIRIELLRYAIYENGILQIETENYEQVKEEKQTSKAKIKKEKLVYSLEDHLLDKDEKIKKLFYALREKIMSLDKNIIEETKAKYIAYKLSSNFVDVVILSNSLKIFLNVKSGDLNDKWRLARDLTKPKPIGHWGNGDYEVKIDSLEDIEKVFELIQQSYEYNR
ncbi:DUF5655 domain-containing protein [Thermoflavifilum thermophilum]|nr:DUF5655 domain-containing protein [Thermoflavifilum thermophilum]